MLPTTSRTRAVTTVSPGGKLSGSFICPQNWILLLSPLKRNPPSANVVQASVDLMRPLWDPKPSLKRQARSLIASATDWVGEKSTGFTAGTPPVVGGVSSHTSLLPSPNACDTSICNPGSTLGSAGLEFNVLESMSAVVPPGFASKTIEKPEPNERS